ncbi:hypothetical protein DL89DRAFT_269825 [Linderina pennispora]|uniref:Uncharacterized protein n=1 Tax=Linderina pennispora TaxID=61395 RepID=A0A1Y1VZV8_9FUNG|nr:uncharacterized protein DL89DRAFT_269825 [Linderina pennispora]ORX66782.1 hypothetical protein DL89DRAFT_269825 [Linderina pennispora]
MPSWTSVAVLQYSLHKCATTPHPSILIQLKCAVDPGASQPALAKWPRMTKERPSLFS